MNHSSPSVSAAVVRPPATRLRTALRRLLWVLLGLWFIASGAFLFARYVLVPRLSDYRVEIAEAASRAVGLPLSIDTLTADWSGVRPRLHLGGITVHDEAGRPALSLARVDATLSLESLLRWQPHFHRLDIHSPELALRRERDGGLVVAGLRINAEPGGGGFLEWLLAQRQIVIHDATLSWTDDYRNAPELRLEKVDFRLDRRLFRHRFALHAQPPGELASELDLRGELSRLSLDHPLSSKGTLYVDLQRASLGGWAAWVDYPLPLKGEGSVRMWVDLDGEAVQTMTADVSLEAVSARLGEGLPELDLSRLEGRLIAGRAADGMRLTTEGLRLATVDGLVLPATDFTLRWRGADARGGEGGELRANLLDLAVLARLAAYLPLADPARERLAASDLHGQVGALNLTWRGDAAAPQGWTLAAKFEGVGLAAHDALPGFGGLSGELEGNERDGRFHISGMQAHLDLPRIFEQSRLALSSLQVEGGWSHADGRLKIALDKASFDNPDAAGDASGSYWPAAGSAGEIDLQARLTRADSSTVWRYLPRVVNNATRDWVRNGIRRATVPETRLQLKGHLDNFPFYDGKGQFLVAIKVVDGVLDYAPGWPVIEGLNGEVRFEGPGLRIEAAQARIFGVALTNTVASAPDLDAAGGPVLTIVGKAGGPTAEFLRFVSASPVAEHIGHFTDGMRAEGTGKLDLRLVMPLHALNDTKVGGEYRFAANRLWLVDGLAPLEDANGRLRFSATELTVPEAHARLFGEPLQLSARTDAEGEVTFFALGTLPAATVQREYANPLLAHLGGSASWQADIAVRHAGVRVSVRSELDGITSSLPYPLNKAAAEKWPLRVEVEYPDSQHRTIRAQLAERLQAEIEHGADAAGWQVKRGGIGIFQPPRVVDGGVMAAASFDEIDLDAWRRVFAQADGQSKGAEKDAGQDAGKSHGESGVQGFALAGVTMQARKLHLYGQTLGSVQLRALSDAGGWKAHLDSDRAQGDFDWREAGDGTLVARFKRLTVGGEGDEDEAPEHTETPARRLPGLDVTVEQFMLRGLALGQLKARARNHDGQWQLEHLSLDNPDGKLLGSGVWQSVGEERSRLEFRLETGNIGHFFRRLGYADAVRGGRATLGGDLSWRGPPTRIDYPSLSGMMKFEAEKGQFNKLDPGVGRLLGVLSLQALPRRITLDFRDVFSEGFSFDHIAGDVAVARGVMSTSNLEIVGAAARVQMRGTVDIAAETQDLRVTVQPTLSESIAIGAAAGLINPVAGVVTYLAQKALSDPVERFFAFDYTITGTWDDPQVAKLGSTANNLIPRLPGHSSHTPESPPKTNEP